MAPDREDLKAPPEQEALNRQLEALGRYVSGLQQQREQTRDAPAQPPPAPGWRRPARLWLLLTGVLVVLALVVGLAVGAAVWSDDRPAGAQAGASGSGTAAAAPVASPACKTAVDRANAMLASVAKLRQQVAEYGRIMGDPSVRARSVGQVVDKNAPALRSGAREVAVFDQALAEYRRVVDQCQLRTP